MDPNKYAESVDYWMKLVKVLIEGIHRAESLNRRLDGIMKSKLIAVTTQLTNAICDRDGILEDEERKRYEKLHAVKGSKDNEEKKCNQELGADEGKEEDEKKEVKGDEQ